MTEAMPGASGSAKGAVGSVAQADGQIRSIRATSMKAPPGRGHFDGEDIQC